MKEDLNKIEIRQRLIIDEWFINGFNGLQAYKKINPKSSDDTCKVNFSKLLTYTNVQQYIQDKQKRVSEDSSVTHQEIVNELKSFAFLDTTKIVSIQSVGTVQLDEPGKLFTQKVIIKNFDELTDVQKRSIESIKETRNGIEVKFFPKATAFEMLNKHVGLYEADNKQKAIIEAPKKVILEFKKFSEDKKE